MLVNLGEAVVSIPTLLVQAYIKLKYLDGLRHMFSFHQFVAPGIYIVAQLELGTFPFQLADHLRRIFKTTLHQFRTQRSDSRRQSNSGGRFHNSRAATRPTWLRIGLARE